MEENTPDPFFDDPAPASAVGTYEFRWDVEVPVSERRYGQKFMKQWKRVLQVQKMMPLVSAHLAPQHARFQLCVASGDEGEQATAAHEAEIVSELTHLKWPEGRAEGKIEGEPAGPHPSGWQGVRVWMTFARQDVESVLGKKAKI